MDDELMKIQNIKLQLKNIESQFDNLEIQKKNINMMMNFKFDNQIERLGIQMLNFGIQMLNIIKEKYMKTVFEQKQFDDNIQNIIKQLKNLFYCNLNLNMMNQNIGNQMRAMNNQMNMMNNNQMNMMNNNQMNMMNNNQMNMMNNNQMNMMNNNIMNPVGNMAGNERNCCECPVYDNKPYNDDDDDITDSQNPIFNIMKGKIRITFQNSLGEKQEK